MLNASIYTKLDEEMVRDKIEWFESAGYRFSALMKTTNRERFYTPGIDDIRSGIGEYLLFPHELNQMYGMFKDDIEPSICAELSLREPSEYKQVVEFSEAFAKRYRQEEVHLLGTLGSDLNRARADHCRVGATLEFAWLVCLACPYGDLREIKAVLNAHGISGFSCQQLGQFLMYTTPGDLSPSVSGIPAKFHALRQDFVKRGWLPSNDWVKCSRRDKWWFAELTIVGGL